MNVIFFPCFASEMFLLIDIYKTYKISSTPPTFNDQSEESISIYKIQAFPLSW